MFDRILVAFDGSEPARKAADKAAELGEELDAEVHFIEIIDVSHFPGVIDWDEVIDRIKLERSEELDEAVKTAKEKDVYESSNVTRGIPHEEITNTADDINADLIVMGKTGKSGIENMMGSTTHRVMEKSDTPILTVSK